MHGSHSIAQPTLTLLSASLTRGSAGTDAAAAPAATQIHVSYCVQIPPLLTAKGLGAVQVLHYSMEMG